MFVPVYIGGMLHIRVRVLNPSTFSWYLKIALEAQVFFVQKVSNENISVEQNSFEPGAQQRANGAFTTTSFAPVRL
jgi:hypothetical protein